MTNPYINKYEMSRIIGARAEQISRGAPIMFDNDAAGIYEPVDIAMQEYRLGVIPLFLRRNMPDKTHIMLSVPDLLNDNYRDED